MTPLLDAMRRQSEATRERSRRGGGAVVRYLCRCRGDRRVVDFPEVLTLSMVCVSVAELENHAPLCMSSGAYV